MNYRVTWFIEVDADSPREAADSALGMQRDPQGIATIFTVEDENGGAVCIDADTGEVYPSDMGKAVS